MEQLSIFTTIPDTPGWSPARHMQTLLSRLSGAQIIDLSARARGKVGVALDRLRKRALGRPSTVAICIAPNAHEARAFYPALTAAGGFETTVLWLFDSFWTDSVEAEKLQVSKHFDLVIYMQAFDDTQYSQLFPGRVLRLEWGSDVLGLGGSNRDRPIDVLRVGRQPAQWEDDDVTGRACADRGLRFSGRPPFAGQTSTYSGLQKAYGQAKYVIAHSNIAAPASYTHPEKAYVTARWTDALASGASVAGVAPKGDLSLVDWPNALFDMPSIELEPNLDLMVEAVRRWTPADAARNYHEALRRLDWRWRFLSLMDTIEIGSASLNTEIQRLDATIQASTAE